jgi:hypothetical protein
MNFNRLFARNNQTDNNVTKNNSDRSTLDDLKKDTEILDTNAMNKVEGGHTSNPQFPDLYDWTSTPGGNVPS